MNIKDLLNPEKMKELEAETNKLRNFGIKESIKNNKPKDNFSDLQKLEQEGEMFEYRPEEF